MAGTLLPIHFRTLARPYGGTRPHRTMGHDTEGPLWRDIEGLRNVDGIVTRKEPLEANAAYFDTTKMHAPMVSGEEANAASIPRLIKDFAIITAGVRREYKLMVTSREIFWFNGVNWFNITPQYTVGTIDVTNGSDQVDGNGTFWADRGLHKYNTIVMPDGDLYTIDSVDSNVLITLAQNYGGATLSTQAYTIHRTRTPMTVTANTVNKANHYFAFLFQGDLYLGGDLGAIYPNVNAEDLYDGAIIKWSDVINTLPASTNASFIFGGQYAYDSGTDNVGYWAFIKGMKPMADGRVFAVGSWADTSTTDSGNNRVWYSSHVNVSIWTITPAGATDIPTNESEVTALGQIGSAYTIHFMDSIWLAYPSGQADPPLEFQLSQASRGALAPSLLQNDGSREIFLSKVQTIEYFDGQRNEILFDLVRPEKSRTTMFQIGASDIMESDDFRERSCSGIYRNRDEFRIFAYDASSTSKVRTRMYAFNYRNGNFWKAIYKAPIGAVLYDAIHDDKDFNFDRAQYAGLAGIPAWDTVAGAVDEPIFYFGRRGGVDDSDIVNHFGDSTDDIAAFLESDDLDFGLPGIAKYIDHITLFFAYDETGGLTGGSETLEVAISADHNYSQDKQSQSFTWVNGSHAPPATFSYRGGMHWINFYFEKEAAESWRIRVGTAVAGDPGNGSGEWEQPMRSKLMAMTVWVVPGGLIEGYKGGIVA